MIPDGLLEILERAKGFGPFTPTLAIVAMRRAWEFPVRPIARIGCCVPRNHSTMRSATQWRRRISMSRKSPYRSN